MPCVINRTLPSTNLVVISLIMCQSAEDLKDQAGWDGASGNSRRNLLAELSSKCEAESS